MNEHEIENQKYIRFFKAVDDIQSLYKAEIAGNLSDHFKLGSNLNVQEKEYNLSWLRQVSPKIKNAVQNEVDKILNSN